MTVDTVRHPLQCVQATRRVFSSTVHAKLRQCSAHVLMLCRVLRRTIHAMGQAHDRDGRPARPGVAIPGGSVLVVDARDQVVREQ
jgi:hypothetical protein